ncbi:hypothetical protein BJ912DRAFT_314208 [Pholiota molesta]|nr:hypothetical protein BJ912DRAFT_314208 [Pholiota molesta]
MAPCRARAWRSLCPFFLLNVPSSTGPSVSLFLEQSGVRIRAKHRRTAKVSIPRSSPPAHNAIDRKAGPTFSVSCTLLQREEGLQTSTVHHGGAVHSSMTAVQRHSRILRRGFISTRASTLGCLKGQTWGRSEPSPQ